MTKELLDELRKITPEEQRLLSGEAEIEKEIYMSAESDKIDAKKLLETGKMIQVRTHTRFVHFPKHTHNYIEVIYMCEGSTHHVINGTDIILQQGELLFLNQNAKQEIYPAGENDIAVNFIILPEFFDYSLVMMGEENNLLRQFVVNCLRGENGASAYMHFKVADVLPVQNLIENMVWNLLHRPENHRAMNQMMTATLFMQLSLHTDKLAKYDSDIFQDVFAPEILKT